MTYQIILAQNKPVESWYSSRASKRFSFRELFSHVTWRLENSIFYAEDLTWMILIRARKEYRLIISIIQA